jgi:hypothetical protein
MSIFKGRSASGLRLCALAAALAFSTTPAAAAVASLTFPLNAAGFQNGATGGSTINLGNAGNPGFILNFVLPRDYQPGGAIRVVFYLQSAGSPCTARIAETQTRRIRPGGFISIGSMTGNPRIAITEQSVAVRQYVVNDVASFLPGDAMTIFFTRETDDPSDTCAGTVFVYGIDIRYDTP